MQRGESEENVHCDIGSRWAGDEFKWAAVLVHFEGGSRRREDRELSILIDVFITSYLDTILPTWAAMDEDHGIRGTK